MGAQEFGVKAEGKTAKAAFSAAVKDARYYHGHGGYTGTIAEKDSFVEIKVPEAVDPIEYAWSLIEKEDSRVDDKWGPAGGVKIAEGKWYFFGWASS